MADMQQAVQDYYGKQLTGSQDLQTNACTTTVNYPDRIKKIIAKVHDEVVSKYYGCGLCIPDQLGGLKVMDLGSGSGRDCFIASALVGEDGYVIGVDFTKEQLELARKHIAFHTEAFGYKKANVEFLEAAIEEIDTLEIADQSLDLIISNCVINLTQNKAKVLRDCYHKLKEGGEMYFSDVYVNRRLPQVLQQDPLLYGECLGGALYWNDFLDHAIKAGFRDPRVVEASPIVLHTPDLQKKLQGFEFYSVTYRLFKIASLEKDCEDYGQAVIYKGSIEENPQSFRLDQGHVFEKGRVHPVCGNTFDMITKTRFAEHFDAIGNTETHFGIFPGCGTDNPFAYLHKSLDSGNSSAGNSCC